MSHFSVMIIGSNPEKQLEPYWELDLTQEDAAKDPRSEFDDYTDEVKKDWEALSAKDKKDYADSTEFAMEYHGYSFFEGKYGYWGNPNAKWDWYQLGGRWGGYFKVKQIEMLPSPELFNKFGFAQAEFEKLIDLYKNNGGRFEKAIEKYGTMGEEIKEAVIQATTPVYHKHKTGEKGLMDCCQNDSVAHTDQLLKKDIDLEGMYIDAMKAASEQYDEFEEATEGLEIPPRWDDFRKGFDDIQDARISYGEFEFVRATRRLGYFGSEVQDMLFLNDGGREKFIENSKCQCLIPFAFVKDGKWYEKGSMGWWGIVSDEKLQYDWSAKFMELWEALPEDTLISMYDCHI